MNPQYWRYDLDQKAGLTGDTLLAVLALYRQRHPWVNGGGLTIHTQPGLERPELDGVTWGDNPDVPYPWSLYFVVEGD